MDSLFDSLQPVDRGGESDDGKAIISVVESLAVWRHNHCLRGGSGKGGKHRFEAVKGLLGFAAGDTELFIRCASQAKPAAGNRYQTDKPRKKNAPRAFIARLP